MTAPVGFLDFFVLEASDYIEQLDAQLLVGGAGTPDADAMQRAARALRGSATMAKLPALSEMAAGVERVGRALREKTLEWTPALHGVLVAAIDDLKVLLRNVRAWSPSDDARARVRVDELTRFVPAKSATPMATPTTASHDSYLATEASNIGAGLELLATRPSDKDAAGNVLRRVRALRGIASVKDHPSLADVLEASEQAAHPLELGAPTLSPERVALLAAAATVLRTISAAMRAGKAIDPSSGDLVRFAAALDAMQERETGSERVVPIAELFYDDGGATVVEAAPNPPTSPAERFRLEVVSQGEHLRRVIGDARGVRDELARERVRRALRQALRSLGQAAESFGEQEVADFVASHSDAVVRLDAGALDSLDQVASLLAQPGSAGGNLVQRLAALQRASAPTAAPAAPAPASAPPPPPRPAVEHVPLPTPSSMTPVASSPAVAPPTSVPQQRDRPAAAAMAEVASTIATAVGVSAGALGDLLDSGIRNLGVLHTTPLSNPVAIGKQPPVPIDRLLYRGRSALQRAREIRDELRGASGPVDAAALGELFDLLDLALTD
jgi:HPt (histidine-containing phosphotransfer) domain-containing protein